MVGRRRDDIIHLERKKDLSIYYWLKELFVDTPQINVVDGYPSTGLTLPTISIEGRTIVLEPHELGNYNRIFKRLWFIEIFAINKTQRDELAYTILTALQQKINVYDYDEGFPPDVSPTQLGCLDPLSINMETVKVRPELVSKLYYRNSISFTAEYDKF